jgi:hypothetical protein
MQAAALLVGYRVTCMWRCVKCGCACDCKCGMSPLVRLDQLSEEVLSDLSVANHCLISTALPHAAAMQYTHLS